MQLEALYHVIPPSAIVEVLHRTGRQTHRERKLNLVLTVWVIVAMYLFPHCSVKRVLAKLAQGVRLFWGDGEYVLPGESALAYRRTQVGVPPLALLCRQLLRPLARPSTAGAFAWGLRLMALDGTVDAVPDTPANVRVFGRAKGGHGISAFPQVRGVHLVECGTHAIVDATFWPYHVSERRGTFRLLRSVQPGWLIMWDGGLHDFALVDAVVARGSHVLAVLPAGVKPEPIQTLGDGTVLAYLRPSDPVRRRRGDKLPVRLLEYRIIDPARANPDRVYRLVTTLLDPIDYPAVEVIATYHSRWEFEVTMDEVETHQRLAEAVLRGLTPARVLQELYGLVLAHYVVRALMHEAALTAGLTPTRLSFVQSLELVRQAVLEFQVIAPDQQPALRARLLRDLARTVVPVRRRRTAPRVVKQRHSKYLRKRAWHAQVLQPQKLLRNSIQLLI